MVNGSRVWCEPLRGSPSSLPCDRLRLVTGFGWWVWVGVGVGVPVGLRVRPLLENCIVDASIPDVQY